MKDSINAIRFTGVDMCNKAESGHPGIVLGAAPVVYRLFTKHMKATPNASEWFNRDRFVLSAGHGSALLYTTLHFAGYDITIDDLKRFRQLDSITPGHPEYGMTDGVEATTGPLGQGISTAVGMAIAEAHLRGKFNKDDINLVDHYTYTLVGDGDLQEGVAMESMSLAGHLGLERLIVLFDSNDVQLDGPTEECVSDDMRQKVESMNWDYQYIEDSNDIEALDKAIENAKSTETPSFIEIKSIIGYGSPKAGTSAVHGAPIGKEETEDMRQAFGYTYAPFDPPKSVYQDFIDQFVEPNDKAYEDWRATCEKYKKRYPEDYETFKRIMNSDVDIDWNEILKPEPIGTVDATRKSMGAAFTEVSNELPSLIGGSADLSGSTKVKGNDGNFTRTNRTGRNINFGVREHAMGAIVNGLTLSGLRGVGSGFLIFSDYMKPAIRIAALSHIPSIFLFTHDSIAVGEDGPTHEPIEQLSVYRATPNTDVLRPANANETKHALRYAVEQTTTPTIVALTRQKVTLLNDVTYETFKQGAYVASDREDFEGILIATGSEVELALKAQEILEETHGVKVRVVSMPSMEAFKRQPESIREKVLPSSCTRRLAIELGSAGQWYQFARDVKGLEKFGKSAKGGKILEDFGFTPEAIAERFLDLEQ